MSIDPFNAFLFGEPRLDEDASAIGVKDVIDVVGMPTTAASKVLYRIPTEDADCVARLRERGARLVGKLNTHEFAFGALTNSPHFGPALNPWNLAHSCGGSSGGSGAAVAAGLVDAALGTDTAGSIRIPAAFCGVTGFRPSTGLVPTRGVVPVAWSLDAVGPLARTAAECGRLLEIMAGRPLPARDGEPRVGIVTSLFEQADAGVATACEEALADLAGAVEPVAIPLHEEIATITQLIMLPEAAAAHLHWLRTRLDLYGEDVRARLLAGLLLPSTAHVTGARARRWVAGEWERSLGRFDLVVAPAMPITAPRLDAVPDDYRLVIMPYNSPAALLGLPVAVVPCGLVDGLPVALSITGRRGEDGTVLAAARAFQQATGRHELRPPTPVDGTAQESYTTSTSQQRGA